MIAEAGVVALLVLLPSAADDGWEQIDDEEGIVVWRREVPGDSLVEFRGRGKINAHIKKVLAVLHDQERKTEWLARCRENRLVRAKSIDKNIIYNRVRSDFPLVDDRDAVLETSLDYWPEQRKVRINVWNTTDPLVPPVDGVVRIPRLKVSWTLIAIDEKTTDATYQVQADPGGSIPHWVVNYVSKEIPFKTIANLRKQVVKDGYDKNLMLIEAAYDWDAALLAAEEAKKKEQAN
jgi:hypothetical protein